MPPLRSSATLPPGAGHCESFRPYRHLAVRVLARAFLDLRDLSQSAATRESARFFLSGNGLLCHWCRVAALDPGWIVKQAAMVQGVVPLIERRRRLGIRTVDDAFRPHTVHDR
jgi:hypothetical protein